MMWVMGLLTAYLIVALIFYWMIQRGRTKAKGTEAIEWLEGQIADPSWYRWLEILASVMSIKQSSDASRSLLWSLVFLMMWWVTRTGT